jgi:hypothetical protein
MDLISQISEDYQAHLTQIKASQQKFDQLAAKILETVVAIRLGISCFESIPDPTLEWEKNCPYTPDSPKKMKANKPIITPAANVIRSTNIKTSIVQPKVAKANTLKSKSKSKSKSKFPGIAETVVTPSYRRIQLSSLSDCEISD